MHPDLRWIAEHVSEWPDNYLSVDLVINDSVRPYGKCCNYFESRTEGTYAKPEWLQARKDLGLEPAWAESVPDGVITDKQPRYLDAKGDDWIDEFARTATVDEFRGAMRFTIGKYVRRAGKKDDINKELDKIIDYCQRWKGYERDQN